MARKRFKGLVESSVIITFASPLGVADPVGQIYNKSLKEAVSNPVSFFMYYRSILTSYNLFFKF